MEIKEQDLVMLRLDTEFGYTNTWWRVLFLDNDNTFIGKLERCHWREYTEHKIGDHQRFNINWIKSVYNGEQFCYSDNVTTCDCVGLCKDK